MKRWILSLALLGFIPMSAIAISGNAESDNALAEWNDTDIKDIGPHLAQMLSEGPINPTIHNRLLLLSEDERLMFRGFLLQYMSEQDIADRSDVFDVVGYPEGTLINAEIVNESGRIQSAESENEPVKAGDWWQLYVWVPFYSQNDIRWQDERLGYDYCGNSKIGPLGCHLTSVSMLYAKWGYPEMTPLNLNNWSNGGRAGHYAFYTIDCGDLINPTQALQYPGICRPWSYISANDIYGQLQRGRPVIANTQQYPPRENHFVVIFGFDGARYWVKDPVMDWTRQDQPLGTVKNLRLYGYSR